VYNEHSAACATCQNFTVDATGVPGTPVVATVNTVIGTDATANCTTCHDKKLWSNATSTHGGHSSSDFAWTPAMETSCGTVTCHDSATNTNVVGQVHDGRSAAFQGSNCQNCHDNSGGGDGTTIVGEATYGSDGDATVASPTTHTEECIVCHDSTNYHGGAIHHDLADAEAGNCETCHIADVGETTTPQTRALTNLDMPTNLPCNFCHLYFPGNAYQTDANGRVKIFNMDWDPNDTASRWETPVEMPTHAVSKSTNPPIADYSACFACHGATSYTGTNGTAPQVRPFHGYGPPYTGDDGLTGGRGAAFADADHHNVFHDIPPHEGCDPGTSTTSSVHPGPFNFNALGTSTGWDRKQDYNCTETTKVYADSVSNGGGCGGQPRWHDLDPGDFQRKDAVYEAQGEFQVPWDGFADGVLAPGSGSINMDFGSFWGTYHGRSGAVNPTIPLAPFLFLCSSLELY
jgi:hypothetical protein